MLLLRYFKFFAMPSFLTFLVEWDQEPRFFDLCEDTYASITVRTTRRHCHSLPDDEILSFGVTRLPYLPLSLR